MSYQIKSTPFFQRMLSVSKKNGELQKLKEEYERIKDFNEKAIEMKMRQARLKRLFKEIEDIKETNAKRRRVIPQEKPKATIASNQRLENLQRAKVMGQQFSRRNGMGESASSDTRPIGPTMSRLCHLSKSQLRERERQREERKRALVSMRNYYGNQISSWNMQKMLMGKLRTEVAEGLKQTADTQASNNSGLSHQRNGCQTTSDTSLAGKEKLQQRLVYGNTISDLNMKLMSKRRGDQQVNNPSTMVTTLSDRSSFTEDQQYESCTGVQDYLLLDNGDFQPLYTYDPVALEKSLRAQKRWRILAMLLKYGFDSQGPKQPLPTLDEYEDHFNEYQLRSISNDTNLLQTEFIPQSCKQLELSEHEKSEEISKDEILVRMECLATVSTTNPPAVGLLQKQIIPTPPSPLQPLGLKPILKYPTTYLTKEEQVTNLLKNYEPYIEEVVRKEIVELGVQKLREVFEHRND